MSTKPEYHVIDYPKEMQVFIDLFLDHFDYNKKAVDPNSGLGAYKLWGVLVETLLNTKIKGTDQLVKDRPKEELRLLVKCLGHNIGVWDLHTYFIR